MPLRVDKITSVYCRTKSDRLFKAQQEPAKLIHNVAEHIVKNVEIGLCNRVVFKMLDKINPFMAKFPKSGQIILNISDKILKISEKFSGDI